MLSPPTPVTALACLLLLCSLAIARAQTAQADYLVPNSFANLTSAVLAALFAGWTPFNYSSSSVTPLAAITVTALPCLPGSYAPANSQTCTYCPAGTYSTQPRAADSSTCVPCPAGSFSGKMGANSLMDCSSCPPNTYFEGLGATSTDSCQACPANTYSNQPQLRQNCICNNGYTGPGGKSDPCLICSRFVF
jgi:hypothetical protein